jgi:hypothetical protein
MEDHLLSVEVDELHRECLEGVALRHVVLDALLELLISKCAATYPLLLIVHYSC